jgi:hypothetical protein
VTAQGLKDVFRPLPGEAGARAARLIERGRLFGFAFIDHDHAYGPTRRAGGHLAALLKPGGHALFHDFNDVRNATEPETYGVHRAVTELARQPDFAFADVIGCCALVRRCSP